MRQRGSLPGEQQMVQAFSLTASPHKDGMEVILKKGANAKPSLTPALSVKGEGGGNTVREFDTVGNDPAGFLVRASLEQRPAGERAGAKNEIGMSPAVALAARQVFGQFCLILLEAARVSWKSGRILGKDAMLLVGVWMVLKQGFAR